LVSKRKEDYLETMFLMEKHNEDIRITDLSRRLGVKKPTVVIVLEKLKNDGLITHEKYGNVFLTNSGRKYASEVYNKHLILNNFFSDILKLPPEVSREDACQIEHFISDESINRILKLTEYFTLMHCSDDSFTKKLEKYYSGDMNDICGENSMVDIVFLKDVDVGSFFRIIKLDDDNKNCVISKTILPGKIYKITYKDKNKILIEDEYKSIDLDLNIASGIYVRVRR